ncbi:Pimeloyl-ACP methyl ester carboxylesterase [Amycolatopsis marina]|uniref:Pimeloyl-ACP methyl ester carboxylesterase n=1 Tax=Amycolatopsis marina TaxID=490629 RepID=A0A1I1C1E9_9PSEU|nr:alpha/beta hydrolase [Amycolatopsis marina]SFB55942.1 Pimeloyl-ACP methyl ester carboxylesterase [Amycolatopsis marina]
MSTPTVLVPGMLCDRYLFSDVRERLHGPVLDARIDAASIGEMAEQVLSTTETEFVLCGVSLGAIVGFEVLRRAPERVAGFCAVSTNPAAPTGAQLAAWRDIRERVRCGDFSRVVREELLPTMFASPEPGHELEREFTGMAERLGPDVLRDQLAAQATRQDARRWLGDARCPTLVLCGSRDALCPPRWHRELAETVPGAVLRILPGAGHLLPLERPALVAGLLNEWNPVA